LSRLGHQASSKTATLPG
jgi:hypothetical protein